MNERENLREAIKAYIYIYWKTEDDETIERLLAGIMSLIAVEMWDKPYTPMVPPVIIEQNEEEDA